MGAFAASCLVPSPRYSGERVRERGRGVCRFTKRIIPLAFSERSIAEKSRVRGLVDSHAPLSLTLSPEYRGEGTGQNAASSALWP